MDGEVVIKTKIDNSGAEKGLALLKTKLLTGLKTVGRMLGSLLKTVLSASVIMAGALGGIFGVAGIATGFKKAIEDSETLRGNLQYLVAMVQVAVKNIAERMLPTILNIMNAIVNAVYKALIYINAITKAWFKLDLFAGASDQFAENMSNAEKSSKKIKNNLQQAPFDEMNVLSDNNSGDAKTSSAGVPNLQDMDVQIPEWIKWIAENKDLVVSAFAGITAALIAMKLLGLDPIAALGIGVAVAFIVKLIQDVIKFLKDPTFDNFLNILIDIAGVVAGIAIAIGAWPVAVGAAVALIIFEIVKHFDDIMALFDKLIHWIDTDCLDWLTEKFGDFGKAIYYVIKSVVEFGKGTFQSFFGGIKDVIDGIMKLFKGDFEGGIKQIFGGLLKIMTAPLQGFLKTVKEVVGISFEKFREIGTKVGDVIGGAFKGVINGVLTAIENVLNTPIRAINSLIDTINKVPGVDLDRLNTFNLPRLEKGGIINRPGAGVPIGAAIGGERGAEWVQPLTDEQSLDLVADKIGKRIIIDLTNVTEINGRQLNREMKRLNGESDFLYNR